MSQFGEIAGVFEGAVFETRASLAASGVHRALQAGIVGSDPELGAESIVMSGGYEDDEDLGDTIIYTGHGSNDPSTGQQIGDQELTRHNAALAKNVLSGAPVRVIRGSRLESPYAPLEGYRYDGLYRVTSFWQERGRSGFLVWRYRLEKVQISPEPHELDVQILRERRKQYPVGRQTPLRTDVRTVRVIRTTSVAQYVKALYGHRCQKCGKRIQTPAGPYSEAAHIKPLGSPHDGPDVPENVLCLCPNCHVEFDSGTWVVADSLQLIGDSGRLTVHHRHKLSPEFLLYRRDMFPRKDELH